MGIYDYSKLMIISVTQHSPAFPATAIQAKCAVCEKRFSVNGERQESAIDTIKDKYKRHKMPGTNQECYAGARGEPQTSYHRNRATYRGTQGPAPRRVPRVGT